MNPVDRASFRKFLDYIKSSQEVSLAILADDDSLREASQLAEDAGFERFTDAFELARRLGEPAFLVYVPLASELPKPLYDLITQYPLTLVQLQEPRSMQQTVVHPVYEGNAVLVVATKAAVAATQRKGFNLLQRVGMCWQPLPEESDRVR